MSKTADRPAAVILLVTAGSRDEAERIGEGVVEAGLAACGSVIPGVHSFFHSEGRLTRELEAILLIKTTADRAEAAQAFVLEHHSYEVPEVLRIDVAGGSARYLEWMVERTG